MIKKLFKKYFLVGLRQAKTVEKLVVAHGLLFEMLFHKLNNIVVEIQKDQFSVADQKLMIDLINQFTKKLHCAEVALDVNFWISISHEICILVQTDPRYNPMRINIAYLGTAQNRLLAYQAINRALLQSFFVIDLQKDKWISGHLADAFDIPTDSVPYNPCSLGFDLSKEAYQRARSQGIKIDSIIVVKGKYHYLARVGVIQEATTNVSIEIMFQIPEYIVPC